MKEALKTHWPEYLMEAAGLGIFMVSAGLFTALVEFPGFHIRELIDSSFVRRIFIGLMMGLTAVGIIYSPWGKQSGAHINPAVTLTFYRLGKIKFWDALFYVVAQFAGGFLGVVFIGLILGNAISDPSVNYVVTVPGTAGIGIAFIAEFVLSFGLMIMVLIATNNKNIETMTGVFAGTLVALFIIIEAPYSGMSINPARSFGSALPANLWSAFWLYLTAPPAGMLAAAQVYLFATDRKKIVCAKLHHNNDKRCIHCGKNIDN
jgi:aquaporin Z